MEQVKNQHVDPDYSLEVVPQSARKGAGAMFVIMMDYLMHRASYKEGTVVERKVNWGAIAGVVAGALVGNLTGGTLIPSFTWGISAVNAMIVAGVIYFLVDKFVYKGNTGVATAE